MNPSPRHKYEVYRNGQQVKVCGWTLAAFVAKPMVDAGDLVEIKRVPELAWFASEQKNQQESSQ